MVHPQIVSSEFENMQFKTGQAGLLKHFIFSQAGTLSKAINELVMNSIDGKALFISIIIENDRRIIVQDNGVGFKSREEVETLFAQLGFDHETEAEVARKRTYGRFGLGRAQIFAFGRSRWLSNHAEMIVDFKGNTDSNLFQFKEHPRVQHAGCRIEIDLYKPMTISELADLKRTLSQQLAYVPVKVVIGEEQINIPFDELKWTHETENLRFRLSNSITAGLTVYNGGVFIKNYPYARFGISGELTSINKENSGFMLNISRNDITEMQCPLFEEMKNLLAPLAQKQKKKAKLNTGETWRTYASGLMPFTEMEDCNIFYPAKGRQLSLYAMTEKFSNRFGIITKEISGQEAETLTERYGICMLKPSSFEGLGIRVYDDGRTIDWDSLDSWRIPSFEQQVSFFDEFKRVVLLHAERYILKSSGDCTFERFKEMINNITLIDPSSMLTEIRKEDKYASVSPDDYTPTQKAQMNTLTSMVNSLWANLFSFRAKSNRYCYQSKQKINVMLGVRKSPGKICSIAGWAQGTSVGISAHIADMLDGPIENYLYISMLICHELTHVVNFMNGPEREGEEDNQQAHSFRFYEGFEEAVVKASSCTLLYKTAENMMVKFLRERRKLGLKNSSVARRMESKLNNKLLAAMNGSFEDSGDDETELTTEVA